MGKFSSPKPINNAGQPVSPSNRSIRLLETGPGRKAWRKGRGKKIPKSEDMCSESPL